MAGRCACEADGKPSIPTTTRHSDEIGGDDARSGLVSELLALDISSVDELAYQCGRFHHFPFDLEAQRFDSARQTWTGSFLRAGDAARIVTTRWAWVIRMTEFPLIDCEVTIGNVAEVEVQDRAQIGTYTLRQVIQTASGCRFEFHQDCDICVHLNGPFVAEVRDIRELAEVRGRITAVGLVDFGIQVRPAARPL